MLLRTIAFAATLTTALKGVSALARAVNANSAANANGAGVRGRHPLGDDVMEVTTSNGDTIICKRVRDDANGEVRIEEMTRDELYERAKARDIAGRSSMTKEELVEALQETAAGTA